MDRIRRAAELGGNYLTMPDRDAANEWSFFFVSCLRKENAGGTKPTLLYYRRTILTTYLHEQHFGSFISDPRSLLMHIALENQPS